MVELLWVALIFVGVPGAGALFAWIPWQTQLWLGVVLVALGAAGSFPTGALYHLRLYQALRRGGSAPRGWWLHPTALHDRLDPADRRTVMPWFYAGATSFVLVLLGGALTLVAHWRRW